MGDNNQKKRQSRSVNSSTAAKSGTNLSSKDGSKSVTHSQNSRSEKAVRNRYRKIVSYTLSFILSLFMLLATICIISLTSLFSESFFCSVITNDYYEAVLSDIITESEDYTIPAELDVSVLDGVFTITDVKRDVNSHVMAAFRGYNYTPDMQSENNQLYANVEAYLVESGMKVEDEEDTIISSYIEEIDNIYLQRVRIPGINLIKVVREKAKGAVTFALILLFALSAVLFVVLLKLYRYPHKGLRYVAYASGGCSLMSFVVPFILYLSKVYAHVQASPEYFYNFVTNYLMQILFSFMYAALLWLIFTVACVVLVYLSKNGKLNGKLEKKIRKKLMTSRR